MTGSIRGNQRYGLIVLLNSLRKEKERKGDARVLAAQIIVQDVSLHLCNIRLIPYLARLPCTFPSFQLIREANPVVYPWSPAHGHAVQVSRTVLNKSENIKYIY